MKKIAINILTGFVFLTLFSEKIYAQEWLDVLDKVLTKTAEIAEYAEMASVILASDDELEYMLHIRTKAQMEIEHNLYTSDLLNNIGEQLVAKCDRKYLPKGLTYKFYIIDSNGFNAFAIPGGGVYVTRGLYNALNEDELAFVLGHEIGHICERHSVRQIKSSSEFQALKKIALQLIKKESDIESQIDVLTTLAYSAVQSGFSREWETTVDKYGVKLAANAGFDPYGSVGAMSKIAAATNASSFWGANCFLWNTHPNVYKRIDVLKQEAALYGSYHDSENKFERQTMPTMLSRELADYNINILSDKYYEEKENEIRTGQVKLTKDKIFEITGGSSKKRVYYSELQRYYGNSFKMTNFYSASNGWGGGGVVTKKGVPMIFNNEAPLPWGYIVEYEYQIPKSIINCAFTYSSIENGHNDNFRFEDFKDIKRTFEVNEDINLAVKIQRAYNSKKHIELSLYDELSGQLLKNETIIANKDVSCYSFSNLSKGDYSIKLKLKNTTDNEILSSYSEKFQIKETEPIATSSTNTQVYPSEHSSLYSTGKIATNKNDINSQNSLPTSKSIVEKPILQRNDYTNTLTSNEYLNGETTTHNSNSQNQSISKNNSFNKNRTLENYNLTKLEKAYVFKETSETKADSTLMRWTMDNKKETLEHIASELGVTKDELRFVPYIDKKGKIIYGPGYYTFPSFYKINGIRKVTIKRLNNVYYHSFPLLRTSRGCSDFTNMGIRFKFAGEKRFKVAEGFEIYCMKINKKTNAYYKNEIKTMFLCNWVRDFDNNGFDFNEFNGIKRSFNQGEDILLVLGCTSNVSGDWNIEIFDKKNGNIVLKKNGQISRGKNVKTIDIDSEALATGKYLCNFAIKSADYATKSMQETFEIY